MTIEIKQAVTDDIGTIVKISKDFHEEHWMGRDTDFDADLWNDWVKSFFIGPNTEGFIAWEDKEIVGFSIGIYNPLFYAGKSMWSIGFIYIKPSHRNLGVFSKLIEQNKKHAKQMECFKMQLSDGGNYGDTLKPLLKRVGFTHFGIDAFMEIK